MISNEFPPAGECMTRAVQYLETSDLVFHSDGLKNHKRVSDFEKAMTMLSIAESQIPNDTDVTAEDLSNYRRRITDLIQSNTPTLNNFLSEIFYTSSRAINERWDTPCLYRSAIKFLQDKYDGFDDLLDDEDHEFLDEIDDLLKELSTSIEPLPERLIPPGIPDSHWWWRLPSATPEEAADARYDDY
ncbi:hypothetical protein [Nocardia nova]|uniref:hypothetical protein n=1 Tax=Nocardia nova TaxID=37330 RepID=UPI0033E97378